MTSSSILPAKVLRPLLALLVGRCCISCERAGSILKCRHWGTMLLYLKHYKKTGRSLALVGWACEGWKCKNMKLEVKVPGDQEWT